jgi:hypothetical protein
VAPNSPHYETSVSGMGWIDFIQGNYILAVSTSSNVLIPNVKKNIYTTAAKRKTLVVVMHGLGDWVMSIIPFSGSFPLGTHGSLSICK